MESAAMVCNYVYYNLYPLFVGLLNHGFIEFVAAEAGVHFVMVCNSITVITFEVLIIFNTGVSQIAVAPNPEI